MLGKIFKIFKVKISFCAQHTHFSTGKGLPTGCCIRFLDWKKSLNRHREKEMSCENHRSRTDEKGYEPSFLYFRTLYKLRRSKPNFNAWPNRYWFHDFFHAESKPCHYFLGIESKQREGLVIRNRFLKCCLPLYWKYIFCFPSHFQFEGY